MSRPNSQHESRRELLASLASLCGMSFRLRQLSNGSIPDVACTDSQRRLLFVADAKYTESPENHETQIRLHKYMRDIAVYIRNSNRAAVFAICFGRRKDAVSWLAKLTDACNEAGLVIQRHDLKSFSPNTYVLCCFLKQ
jgi:hypothetical protein